MDSVCFMSVFICVWKLSELWDYVTGLRICQVWTSLDRNNKFIIKGNCDQTIGVNLANENTFIVCNWTGENSIISVYNEYGHTYLVT